MDPTNVRMIVAAAREVAHGACNLAAVAASIVAPVERAGDGLGEDAARSGHDAVEASMGAARAAFTLDDIYRRNNGSEPSVEAADAALAAAQKAIEAARAAIAVARPVRVQEHR